MELKNWPLAAIGLVAMSVVASPGQSAPASSGLDATARNSSAVEQAHSRRYRDYRHYRYYRNPGVHFYISPRYRHHRHHRRWD
jgi:hypothetical protein